MGRESISKPDFWNGHSGSLNMPIVILITSERVLHHRPGRGQNAKLTIADLVAVLRDSVGY
jgi:hypothetical protein